MIRVRFAPSPTTGFRHPDTEFIQKRFECALGAVHGRN